jgi:hypothetical protein
MAVGAKRGSIILCIGATVLYGDNVMNLNPNFLTSTATKSGLFFHFLLDTFIERHTVLL